MARILMIEDDTNFIRLVEKVLGEHTVLHSETALGGLQLADTHPIDLVLLDLDLPDLDGKVVATMLRARPALAKTPIIAVTAQDSASARRLSLAFGCNGFIPKPIDTRKFAVDIARYLASSSA